VRLSERETVIKTLGWKRKNKNDGKGLMKAHFGNSEYGG
jgi:hypothetical protein